MATAPCLKALLDLDGVLCDFHTAMCKALSLSMPDPWPSPQPCLFKALGLIETSELWETFDNEYFWANLDWTADGKQILAIVEDFFGPENVCIATTPTRNPRCAAGKVRWIQRCIPAYSRRFFIGPPKYFAAAPTNILIDDSDSNINLFRQHAGLGILVPRPWNTACDLPTLPTLSQRLSSCKSSIAAVCARN